MGRRVVRSRAANMAGCLFDPIDKSDNKVRETEVVGSPTAVAVRSIRSSTRRSYKSGEDAIDNKFAPLSRKEMLKE